MQRTHQPKETCFSLPSLASKSSRASPLKLMCGTGAKECGSIANELFAELNWTFLVVPDQFQEFRPAFDQGAVEQVEGVEN